MKSPCSIRLLLTLVFLTVSLASTVPGRAEDGYRLWLRYEKVQNADKLSEYKHAVHNIIVQEESETGKAISEELKNGLTGLLGQDIPVETSLVSNSLLVGTPSGSPQVKALNWDVDLTALGKEGFLIRNTRIDGKLVTVIASEDKIGLLYGAFHYLRLLQTESSVENINVSQKPKLQLRLLNHWDNLPRTVERGYAGKSIWEWDKLPEKVSPRYQDYARACASLGLNGSVLNNVNASPEQLSSDNLKKAALIADVLRPYGIRVFLSINYATPKKIGGLTTANPTKQEVQDWWKTKVDEIYTLIPDFGGFLVKANSEGQPGPRDYKLTHAEGANYLSDTLASHGGIVMWRCFVYGDGAEKDRAKQAYVEFKPLDGKFNKNVFLQVKNGPIDFQPREMFHPLYGAMPQTPLMAELEITQENLGHSTHLVFLAPMWKEFLDFDTYAKGPGTTIASILESYPMTGIAGVANTGTDRNWCGYDFAQANWYAFGRLAWDPSLTSEQIADEWIRMTWSNDADVVKTVSTMMLGSWEAMVNYEMPIGLTHIMEGGDHYTAAPKQFEDYHRANVHGIGYDRTTKGSNAVSEYAPELAAKYGNLETCPDELLLWFHSVPWDYKMKSDRTVWDELCHRYNAGVDYVKEMDKQWLTTRSHIDPERFEAVKAKLTKHIKDATAWRDVCIRYFQSKNGKSLPPYLKTEERAGN